MNLHEMLKRHEGLSLTPYLCGGGARTIGYGHNYDANPLPYDIEQHLRIHKAITQEMADRLLDLDIQNARGQCRAIFEDFDGFAEARRAALIDLCFNIGANGVLKFKRMLLAIIDRDWDRAAWELKDSKWFKQVGSRGPELVALIKDG